MDKQKASYLDTTENSWREYIFDNKVKEGERLEDAAKFLSGMISISLTIFLKINETAFVSLSESRNAIIVVILWLISLATSFFVFFPFSYRYNEESISSIKTFHDKMVKRKRRLLMLSTFCFFLALLILGGFFIKEIG